MVTVSATGGDVAETKWKVNGREERIKAEFAIDLQRENLAGVKLVADHDNIQF